MGSCRQKSTLTQFLQSYHESENNTDLDKDFKDYCLFAIVQQYQKEVRKSTPYANLAYSIDLNSFHSSHQLENLF